MPVTMEKMMEVDSEAGRKLGGCYAAITAASWCYDAILARLWGLVVSARRHTTFQVMSSNRHTSGDDCLAP